MNTVNTETPIFLAYRRNELFDHYVPLITQGLNVVETFIVPKGTNIDDELREQGLALAKRIINSGNGIFISDKTCLEILREKDPETGKVSYLHFTEDVILNWLFSDQLDLYRRGYSLEENLQWLVEKTLLSYQYPIKRIVVVEENLQDHWDSDYEYFGTGFPCGVEREDTDIAKWFAETMKNMFPKALVSTIPEVKKEELDEPGTLVLVDRHCGKGSWYNDATVWPYRSAVVILPFSSTVFSLTQLGQITDFEFDVEKIRAEIFKKQ
jgi:hypothetical protein